MRLSILLFLFISYVCSAQDLAGYDSYSSGIYNIEDGFVLQGSSDYGGLQPNYDIDLRSSHKIQELMDYARSLRELPQKQIIKRLKNRVRSALRDGSYRGRDYLDLLERYRDANQAVPLAEYLNCSAGVCRENSILMHLSLKEAGVENRYMYVQAQATSMGTTRVEDHALVVVKRDEKLIIVDSYNSNFHNVELDQILGKSKTVGFGMSIKINKINKFPILYVPKDIDSAKFMPYKSPCHKIFTRLNPQNLDDLLFKQLLANGMI